MDPFDLAFGEAVQNLDKGQDPPAKTAEELEAEAAAAAEAAKTDPPQKTAEELEAEAAAAAEAAKTDPPQKTAEELAAEEATAAEAAKKQEPPAKSEAEKALEAENARLKADLEKKKDPPAKTQADLDAEEAAKKNQAKAAEEWESFKKDWAEPAAMMEKMYSGIMSAIPLMIQQAIQEAVAPLKGVVAQSAEEKFQASVTAKHADAFTLVKDGTLDRWIGTLPAFQQAGAKKVLESGSAQEFIELMDAYRGVVPATAPETPEQIAAKAAAEAEKNRKLASLHALPDKRTSAPASKPDPDDFSGAFAEAIASGS